MAAVDRADVANISQVALGRVTWARSANQIGMASIHQRSMTRYWLVPRLMAAWFRQILRLMAVLAACLCLSCLATRQTISNSLAAASPDTGVSITSVTAGYAFGGTTRFRLNGPSLLRPGEVWVPIVVAVQNDGDADVAARIVIPGDDPSTTPTTFTHAVSLPPGARKAVTLYLPATSIVTHVTVDLQVGAQTIDVRTISASAQQTTALSVGVLSDDPLVRATLHSFTFDGIPLSVAQLGSTAPLATEPRALDNFDLIILSNAATATLTPDQVSALRRWVSGGGTLLTTGGLDAQKTIGNLPSGLQAATLQSIAVVTALPELRQIAGETGPTGGPVVLPVAAPLGGSRVLAAHGKIPLAIDRPLGRGHLVYSALDFLQVPLSTWSTTARATYWARLLAPVLRGPLDTLVESLTNQSIAAVGLGGSPRPPTIGAAMMSDVGAIPSRELPARQVYVILIAVYILVIGPGTYVVLRRRRHLEWIWVSVPVLAVVFGLGSFSLAFTRNGGDVQATIDTVVYLDPGNSARQADSYIGLHTPFRGDYELTSPAPALASSLSADSSSTAFGGTGATTALAADPTGGMSADQGSQFSAHLTGVEMWSLRALSLHDQLNVPGDVTGLLTLHGNAIAGTITNGTNIALQDCALVAASGIGVFIPRLNPGQTVHIAPVALDSSVTGIGSGVSAGLSASPLTNLYSQVPNLLPAGEGQHGSATWIPLVSIDRYAAILGALFPNGSPTTADAPLALIGWSTKPLTPLSVNGATPRRSDTDFFVAPLPLSLGKGAFTLAPGDLSVSALDTTIDPTTGPSDGGLLLVGGARLDVQLTLPPATGRVKLATLTVHANPTTNSAASSTMLGALWNWTTQHWESIDLSSGSLTIPHAAAFASPDGRILLRVGSTVDSSFSFQNVAQDVQIGATGRVQ